MIDTATMTDEQLRDAVAQMQAKVEALPVGEERHQAQKDFIALCHEQMRRKVHRKVAA